MNEKMNETEIEQRLRNVVDGPQPSAPASLHRFLRDLPGAQTSPRRGPLGRLRGAFDRAPGFANPGPSPRRTQLAFGMVMAVVLGVAGAGVLLSLRQNPAPPAASGTHGTSTPWVTPRRSIGSEPSPVVANPSFKAGPLSRITLVGVTAIDAENMAMPGQVVSPWGAQYVGVSTNHDGLVRSTDGLYWAWSPATEVDPKASKVTAIAYDGVGTIVATGSVQGVDGTIDGRVWVSSDGGSTWKGTTDESIFRGVTVQLVVRGSGQFIALGWNDLTPADSRRQVGAWRSFDGKTWTHVTVPIQGTAALIVPTAAGFALSGTPLASGAIDEPPMWYSSDGATWNRARATDKTAKAMGPLISASVTSSSHLYAVSRSPDGTNNKLVYSPDGGLTWGTVEPNDSMPFAGRYTQVATFSGYVAGSGRIDMVFVSTGKVGEHIYVSIDGGVTWVEVYDPRVGGPSGKVLLEIGQSYQASYRKILAYGEPGSRLGIWLATLTGLDS